MASGIICRNLCYALPSAKTDNRLLLNNCNAVFPPGRISIICGDVGAGKSTLLHILAGLIRPASGEVIADGEAVSRWAGSHRDRWRRQIGIIFQHYHLLAGFTVLENVMMPLMPLGLRLSECRRRGTEALQQMAILPLAGSPIHTLSGGERQKTAVARALINRPAFVFADEPTAHQDAENTDRVINLLNTCAGREAVVILATHDPELGSLADNPVRFRLVGGRLEMTR